MEAKNHTRTRMLLIGIAAVVVVLIAATLIKRRILPSPIVRVLTGAIIADSPDPHAQRPIGDANVTVTGTLGSWNSPSEVSGLFRVRLEPPVIAGREVEIRVEHPDYAPFVITTAAKEQIYVIRLTPKRAQAIIRPVARETSISNVRVRYATHIVTTSTVGTAVRTFDIVNTGNVPCEGRQPCSPSGRWKARVGELSLDTGDDKKRFQNVRVSCIAGPCPFTAIEKDQFSQGGRIITVSVRNWSDPVTYLLEAEVAVAAETELIRHTYPVTFGRSMNFTLPAVASGPSIEADVDGSEIVFPLGPELRLSWATCRFEAAPDGTKRYSCELKPGYRFE